MFNMINLQEYEAARDAEEQQFLNIKERREKEEMAAYLKTWKDKRIRRIGSLSHLAGILKITDPTPDCVDLSTGNEATNQFLNDPSRNNERPATTRMINQLRDVAVTQRHIDLDPMCIFCQGDFSVNETINVMPACHHYFHKKCIGDWLVQKWTCPICRERLRFCGVDRVRRLHGDEAEQTPVLFISPLFSELVQIYVWAIINRHCARQTRSMRHQSRRVVQTHPVADHADANVQIYRKSDTAFSETVVVVYTIPSSIRIVNLHLNIPASASSVYAVASLPGYFPLCNVDITALVVPAHKEVTATQDIVTMEISGNSGQYADIITNVPAMPAEVGIVNGVEGRARRHRYRLEDIHSNETIVDVPTSVQFATAWQETDIRELSP